MVESQFILDEEEMEEYRLLKDNDAKRVEYIISTAEKNARSARAHEVFMLGVLVGLIGAGIILLFFAKQGLIIVN